MKLPDMKSFKISCGLLGLILALDLSTKYLAQSFLKHVHFITIIPNFFHLTYVENRGAAFGLLAEMNPLYRTSFFVAVSAIAIILIILFYLKTEEGSNIFYLGLLLILGGAIGNLIDRLRLGLVIDFLDFHWYQYHWPAFNIADTAICLGVGLLIIDMIFTSKQEKNDCIPSSLK